MSIRQTPSPETYTPKTAPLVYRLCEKIYNTAKFQFFTASFAAGMVTGAYGGYVATDKTIDRATHPRTEIETDAPAAQKSFADNAGELFEKPAVATTAKGLGAATGMVGGGLALAWAMNTLLYCGMRQKQNYHYKNNLKKMRSIS